MYRTWVYDTVCCTMYSCTMYDQRSVAYTNKNILFVSHVVYQSRTIRIIHEYTERYGGYNKELEPTSVTLKTHMGELVVPVGKLRVNVQYKQQKAKQVIYVTEGGRKVLFGRDWL